MTSIPVVVAQLLCTVHVRFRYWLRSENEPAADRHLSPREREREYSGRGAGRKKSGEGAKKGSM